MRSKGLHDHGPTHADECVAASPIATAARSIRSRCCTILPSRRRVHKPHARTAIAASSAGSGARQATAVERDARVALVRTILERLGRLVEEELVIDDAEYGIVVRGVIEAARDHLATSEASGEALDRPPGNAS
jgi:hypothetical protein